MPRTVRSDNDFCYNSRKFLKFVKGYGFNLVTSSPRYPESNKLAEGAVRRVAPIVAIDGSALLEKLSQIKLKIRVQSESEKSSYKTFCIVKDGQHKVVKCFKDGKGAMYSKNEDKFLLHM